MKRTLSAVEARKHLGEILEGVFYRGDEVIIERAGKPMAVVVPARMYEAMQERRKRFWELIDRAQERNKDVPDEVLDAEIEQAIEEVRAEQKAKQAS